MPSSRCVVAVLWASLVACALKGGAIAAVTPAFQTPDEYGHYDYVLYLSYIDWGRFLAGDVATPTGYNDIVTEELWAVTRATGTESHLRGGGVSKPRPSLAEQLGNGAGYEVVDSHTSLRDKTVVAPQFNYPVLYYGAASVVARVLRAAQNPVVSYYVVRSGSLALTLATVALVWWTAVLAFGRERWLPVAVATAFVALHPQLGMMSVAVQSDVLTTVLVALAGVVAAGYARRSTSRHAAMSGVVVGLLLLTKLHAATAVAAALATLVPWVGWRHRARALAHLVCLASIAALVGGWWYVRAYVLYGSFTGMVGTFRTAQFGGRRANVLTWLSQWRLTHDSFWGMWGWLEVSLPGYVYAGLTALLLVSLLPLLVGWRRRSTSPASAPAGIAMFWATLLVAYAAIMVVVAAYIGPVHNNQGRHWLPVVLPALALALGWSAAHLERQHRPLALALLGTWCAALAATSAALIVATRAFYGT